MKFSLPSWLSPRRERPYRWWQIALFWTGAFAIIATAGNLFLALGDSPEYMTVTGEIPAVASPDFLLALSHLSNSPLDSGGTVTVRENGNAFLDAQLSAIRSAEQSVNITGYIWERGEMSTKLVEALLERQRAGVPVRILYDAVGSFKSPDEEFNELRSAGARVEAFRPLQVGNLTRFHRRNHRRSIVIDGRTGFTGGSAVFDPFLGNGEDDGHWRDLMFEVTGVMARRLQAVFADLWAGTTGEILAGEAFYPRELADTATGLTSLQLVHSPADDVPALSNYLLFSIAAARESIHITTPYLIPDRHLLGMLREKAQAGVEVRIVLPGKYTDQEIVGLAMQSYYDNLMEAGVELYEYERSFNHAKYMIIDGTWVVVGSANLNSRSRKLDEENLLGIRDEAFSRRMEEIFSYDLSYSRKIDFDEWSRKHFIWQPFYTISKLIKEHY